MTIIHTQRKTFSRCPQALRFIQEQNNKGKACLMTQCCQGFQVDVYEEQPLI